MICSPAQAYERKPDWVRREISKNEAAILSREIVARGAVCGAEVGVASGFSSAILYAAMAKNTPSPRLHSIDVSTQCYFRADKLTGAAFEEIHGPAEGFMLRTGVTSAGVEDLEPLDFIFIDGSHATPWPALDLLSLGRFLKPGGFVALDDVDMLFGRKWQMGGKNGARDLFRAWRGKKLRYEGATSLALLYDATPRRIVASVADSMRTDWDVPLPPARIRKFNAIAESYGPGAAKLIARVIESHRHTHRSWRPEKPGEELLTLPD